ncbi:MAG: magnesium/cobalt transporter CorA [Bacteroidia bacterium]|nr:magnesium/cobalt transporter CorA [Bacteroidia bacterium]
MSKRGRLIKKQRIARSGTHPGEFKHLTNSGQATHTRIKLFEFDDFNYTEKEVTNLTEFQKTIDNPTIKWLDIDGVGDVQLIEELGKLLGIHQLTLEDIVNTDQRAKFEDYTHYTLTIVRKIYYNQYVTSEQVSILLLKNIVITFQESNSKDCFESIRERIRKRTGKVRKLGADYLAYVLLDTVVDTYFLILEKIGDHIDVLEEKIIDKNINETLFKDIHACKREMIYLRKSIWPLRELFATMQRAEHPLFTDNTNLYLRDVYDHTVRIIETIEAQRELLSELTEIYLGINANKMNEVMKVLTIISSLFIPLTFIVGVYGMNFDYMPELKSSWGYPVVMFVMAFLFIGMLYYFRKKRWL